MGHTNGKLFCPPPNGAGNTVSFTHLHTFSPFSLIRLYAVIFMYKYTILFPNVVVKCLHEIIDFPILFAIIETTFMF